MVRPQRIPSDGPPTRPVANNNNEGFDAVLSALSGWCVGIVQTHGMYILTMIAQLLAVILLLMLIRHVFRRVTGAV